MINILWVVRKVLDFVINLLELKEQPINITKVCKLNFSYMVLSMSE